jgi:hypothetical protein
MPTAPNDGQEYFALGPAAPNSGNVAPYAVPAMTRADVTITNAQLLAMNTTAITLIPAPPAGFTLNPIWGVLRYNYGTHAFAGSVGALSFALGTTTLAAAPVTLNTTNIAAAASSTEQFSFSGLLGSVATAAAANTTVTAQALTVSFSSANPTAGLGATLHVSIYYTIETAT